ncbi:MraY family glycosyltransferase [Pseudoxanthomonas gei]|uniref:MraY family glycosyltransferase n=1 Tax=Pseudoxanthomonas gei TaxID=1383030 RepID=UPI001391E2D3
MVDLGGVEKGLIAAGLTLLVQWLLHPVANRLDLLDHPKGRKDHAHPTPITGGLAMAVGILVTAWSTLDGVGTPLIAFSLASTLLIVVGLLDDKYDLPWWLRIGVQVIAALIMVLVGGVQVEQLGPVFGLGDSSLGMLSIPFTVFATVGLINAINMVDGSDGMAGSLVLAALVMLVAASLYSGNGAMAERVMIMVGAVAAFLWFNLRFPWQPRARLFMGNAGSAFLGFVIAWVSFRLTQNPGHPVSPILALWLIPVPVMDCLVLMARRMRDRQSPFHADQNHIHHVLRGSGFRPMQKVAFLVLFSGVCGLACGQALRMDIPEPLLLGAFFVLCGGWYWLTSRRDRAIRFFSRLRNWGLLPPITQATPIRAPAVAETVAKETAQEKAA